MIQSAYFPHADAVTNYYFVSFRHYQANGSSPLHFNISTRNSSGCGYTATCSNSLVTWENYMGGRWYKYAQSARIRPIVTLKSNVKFTGGTGTETDPYILP